MSERVEDDSWNNVLMVEEAIANQSYKDGVEEGLKRGQQSGYEFGYIEGVKLGKELAEYFSIALLNFEQNHNTKVAGTLQRLVSAIRELSFGNHESITEEVEKIRLLHKLIQSSCKQITFKSKEPQEKLSF